MKIVQRLPKLAQK